MNPDPAQAKCQNSIAASLEGESLSSTLLLTVQGDVQRIPDPGSGPIDRVNRKLEDACGFERYPRDAKGTEMFFEKDYRSILA